MKKTALLMGVFAMACSLFLTCSSMSMNPKRMACNESCAQARQKCITDAKDNAAKKLACDVAHDQCRQKCANEFR